MQSLVSQKDICIAYYFFDSAQQESLLPRTFLRSILHQVLPIDLLSPALQRRLEAVFVGPNGRREPEFDELTTLVLDLFKERQKIIIFFDGISELEQDGRRLVLHFILQAVQQKQAAIKLFVTSRPDIGVPIFFSDRECAHINIQNHDTQFEIDKFINVRVEEETKDGTLGVCGPATIDKIKKVLKMKAGGMYDIFLINHAELFNRLIDKTF